MRQTVWALCRVALAAFVAVGSVTTVGKPLAGVKAADASTWYWQNPLPQEEDMAGVACPTVTACVAVGGNGIIVTTDDGGQHWTHRTSGTEANLSNVTCPDRTICYALGAFPGNSPKVEQSVFLTSVDSGETWQQPSSHLPTRPGQYLSELVCPSVATCLSVVVGYPNVNLLLRTATGGRTWHVVNVSRLQFVVLVTCATKPVCYAMGPLKNGGRSNPGVGFVRSTDGGKTWKVRGQVPPGGFSAMACPQERTCFATASNCGAECSEGDVFLTRDSAKTWKEVAHNVVRDQLGNIACPSVTICSAHGTHSVVRTTNGGKTWSIRHLPDPTSLVRGVDLACPGPAACYVAAGFTVLKTSDGFDRIQETLAQSVIHDLSLTGISCPSTASCYAAGNHNTCPRAGSCYDVAAPFAVTSDGGRTWRETPKPPDLFAHLSCPSPRVCYAISPFSCCSPRPRDAAVYRSGDGTKTWQRTTVRHVVAPFIPDPNPDALAPDISCVTVTTCYVAAMLLKVKGNSFAQRLTVLVTRNGGRKWRVRTGIDAAVRAGAPHSSSRLTLDAISCPSVMTCMVAANASGNDGRSLSSVFLSTTDGGKTWRRHSLPSGGRRGRLVCPTITTCYVLLYPLPGVVTPATVTAFVLATHDAGVRWHRTVVSPDGPLGDIACASAQVCRVLGKEGIYATEDGGMTWQSQFLANGKRFAGMASIACPAVDTCYAVGGVMIVATGTGTLLGSSRLRSTATGLPNPGGCIPMKGNGLLHVTGGSSVIYRYKFSHASDRFPQVHPDRSGRTPSSAGRADSRVLEEVGRMWNGSGSGGDEGGIMAFGGKLAASPVSGMRFWAQSIMTSRVYNYGIVSQEGLRYTR